MRAPLLALVAALLAGSCTAPNPDYDPDAAAALCAMGQRRCGGGGQTQVCTPQADSTLAWSDDYCPAGAVCDAGRCGPPAGAASCARDADCGADVCVVFVAGGLLGRFCAPATGPQAGAGQCDDHTDCRSGLCQLQPSGPRLCFAACAETTDCTGVLTCQESEVTVSGVRGTMRGCRLP